MLIAPSVVRERLEAFAGEVLVRGDEPAGAGA